MDYQTFNLLSLQRINSYSGFSEEPYYYKKKVNSTKLVSKSSVELPIVDMVSLGDLVSSLGFHSFDMSNVLSNQMLMMMRSSIILILGSNALSI